MKRLLIAVSILYCGYLIGTIQAAYTLELHSASADGVLIVHDIEMLEAGKVEELVRFKQAMLGVAFHNASTFRSPVYKAMTWPVSTLRSTEEYYQRIVDYKESSATRN